MIIWFLLIIIIILIITTDTVVVLYMLALALGAVVALLAASYICAIEAEKAKTQPGPKPTGAHDDPEHKPTPPRPKSTEEIYGPKYEQWRAYQQSYDVPPFPQPVAYQSYGELDRSVDTSMVMLNRGRARDKRKMDGAICKDTYFYKYHFGHELDEAAAKPWWSTYEY